MRKKWTTSSRKPKDLTPEQQKEVLAPNLITSLFNTITKLDRNELDKFIANMKNRENSEMISTDVILKQKLWGLSIGHVVVNRSDDEICSCSEGKDVMIEKVNEMLIYLMDMGLDLNVEERKNKILPIHLAAERCSYSFKWIMTMIEKGNQGATTCCGSELGFTPLDYAISNNRLELVTHMLDCETVDFGEFSYSNHHNEENRRRLLPFHVASQSGNVGILEFLINHACKYYVNNNPKLEQLVEFTNSSISSISLNEFTKQFLSIKTQDVNAQTALHLAVREGHISCVKLLLENGADPLLSDQNDKTVIDYTRINFINRHAIIEELQKYVNFEILPPPERISIIPISTIQPEISNVGEAENVNQELEELRSESSNQDEEENENIYFM